MDLSNKHQDVTMDLTTEHRDLIALPCQSKVSNCIFLYITLYPIIYLILYNTVTVKVFC